MRKVVVQVSVVASSEPQLMGQHSLAKTLRHEGRWVSNHLFSGQKALTSQVAEEV
jgi:hypothetical protein